MRQKKQDQVGDGDSVRITKAMPKNHLDNVIRWIKSVAINRLESLEVATGDHMKRLGRKRNATKAIKGIPEGSSQGDLRSILVWMDKVEKKDKTAVGQIVAIDATVARRLEG